MIKRHPRPKLPKKDVEEATTGSVVDFSKIRQASKNRKKQKLSEARNAKVIMSQLKKMFQELHEEIFGTQFPFKGKTHFVTVRTKGKLIRRRYRSDSSVLYEIYKYNKAIYGIDLDDFKRFLLYVFNTIENTTIKNVRQVMSVLSDESDKYFIEKYKRQIGKRKLKKQMRRVEEDAKFFE